MGVRPAIDDSVVSSVALSVAGVGSGVLPAPELLVNASLTGYSTGSPGTGPTGWTDGVAGTNVLSEPKLTFGCTVGRRYLFQTVNLSIGTFECECVVTLNSGTATIYDLFVAITGAGQVATYKVDGVELPYTTDFTGTHTITITVVVSTVGPCTFRMGVGCLLNRIQNATFGNPSLIQLS